MMKSLLLLSSLLASSALVSPPGLDVVMTRTPLVFGVPDVLPAAKSGLAITIKDMPGPSLYSVLDEYQRVTGIHLVIGAELLTTLSKSPTGLTQSLDIPAAEVHPVVEQLLLQAGCCTILLHATEPMLVGVVAASGLHARAGAVYVPSTEIASVAIHPALTVWTVVDVEHADAVELVGSLQSRWRERDYQAVSSVPPAHGILLLGSGADVAQRVRFLHEFDEAAGRVQTLRAKESSTSGAAVSNGSEAVKK